MHASTLPRSPTPRAGHTPTLSHSSFSLNPSSKTISFTSSSLPKASSNRKHSISNPMHWLARSSTQSSASGPYAATKPTQIAEPKVPRSIELLSSRTGVLGSGATVVRTPDEALREISVRLTYDRKAAIDKSQQSSRMERSPSVGSSTEGGHDTSEEYHSSSSSPPLPPLPASEGEELRDFGVDPPKQPSKAARAPPPAPPPSLRPSLRNGSRPNTDEPPVVPELPSFLSPTPPPFKPILVSDIPSGIVDPSRVIVTIETCTTSYKTTLETINSRPSHLSTYMSSLFPRSRKDSTASSVYSTESANEDLTAYRQHIASQGLFPSGSFAVHIFLDRSSAPYAHILNYLRSPIGTPQLPETLPRSAQLQSSAHARLEALLELRDEAAYLDLQDLYRLCTEEIQTRSGSRLHNRGHSTSASANGSVQSLHASVYSLRALLERVEDDMRPSQRHSNSSDIQAKNAAAVNSTPESLVPARSPPTPQSWKGPSHSRGRSSTRQSPARQPPVGWI